MESDPQHLPGPATHAWGGRSKPLRFRLGIGLIELYPVIWLFVAVVAFLPWAAGTKAAVIGAEIAAAEVLFVVGVACIGKEAYQAIKARYFRGRKPGAITDGTD